MPFLSTTFDLHHLTNLPADTTIKDVLNVLHDPQQSIGLSPIVYSVTPDPTREESHFVVTERVPVLGSIYYPTTYKVKWTSVPNGCEWDVQANFGIRITNRMKVENKNGAVIFTDDLTAQASVFVMPFVRITSKSAHAKVADRLLEKVLANRK